MSATAGVRVAAPRRQQEDVPHAVRLETDVVIPRREARREGTRERARVAPRVNVVDVARRPRTPQRRRSSALPPRCVARSPDAHSTTECDGIRVLDTTGTCMIFFDSPAHADRTLISRATTAGVADHLARPRDPYQFQDQESGRDARARNA